MPLLQLKKLLQSKKLYFLIEIMKHSTYVTHLHKTSHKSPNIKWQKIAFYLKMSKKSYFLFLSKQHILGKTLSKYLFFILFW